MLHSQVDGFPDLDGAGICLPVVIRSTVVERARCSWVGSLPVRVMMDGDDDDYESDFDDFDDDDLDDLDEVEEDDFDSLDDFDDDLDDFDDEV